MEDLRNESILEGIDIGDLRTTVKYYKKGKITLEEAAEDLNMTVEEFKEKIQAGTVHAIGAGALVAEIQENSNLKKSKQRSAKVQKNI